MTQIQMGSGAEAGSSAQQSIELPAPLANPRTSRARVLIAGDCEEMFDLVTTLLSTHCDIEQARDHVEALRAIRFSAPDLVLADLQSQRLDGIGFIRAVRADPALPRIPILVCAPHLSGHPSLADAIEAGADDGFGGPFSHQEFEARVAAHLELARMRGVLAVTESRAQPSQAGLLPKASNTIEFSLSQAVCDALDVALLAVDVRGRVVFANPAAERLLGWSAHRVVGRSIDEVMSDPDSAGVESAFSWKALSASSLVEYREDTYLHPDGRPLPVGLTVLPLHSVGIRVGAVIRIENVTGRKRAEAALRLLAVQLSEAEEAERRHLADDLHDSVGQSLALLKIKLEDARTRPQTGDLQHGIEGALEVTGSLIAQVRTMVLDLHPGMIEELGLVPALRRAAGQFTSESGLHVSVASRGTARPVSRAVLGFLYRCVRELLGNVAKHARAREALVTVVWTPERLRIVVDDDGIGFDVEQALAAEHRRGLGLASIRERLSLLGGRLILESRAGEGTRAAIEVILK